MSRTLPIRPRYRSHHQVSVTVSQGTTEDGSLYNGTTEVWTDETSFGGSVDRTITLRYLYGELRTWSECEAVAEDANIQPPLSMDEIMCLCFFYCPWRELTEIEAGKMAIWREILANEIVWSNMPWAICYGVIILVGLTGKLLDFSQKYIRPIFFLSLKFICTCESQAY